MKTNHDFCREMLKAAREEAKALDINIPRMYVVMSKRLKNSHAFVQSDTGEVLLDDTACCIFHAKAKSIDHLIQHSKEGRV